MMFESCVLGRCFLFKSLAFILVTSTILIISRNFSVYHELYYIFILLFSSSFFLYDVVINGGNYVFYHCSFFTSASHIYLMRVGKFRY